MTRWVATVAIACAACGGTKLRAASSSVADIIAKARDSGAVRCAPYELAMAESHQAFAETELDEGDYYRAREELRIAEKNAHEALRLSPRDRCVPRAKKPVVGQVGDRDGDGFKDDVDQCPDAPEDFDDFEDEDGCPDLDNDRDGLADSVDECPNSPEDIDGFEDEDGCPELDNDQDGLNDKVDQCPDEAEDMDGFEDDDGCPDCDNDGDGVPECPEEIDKCPDKPAKTADGCPKYKLVTVTEQKIELKQTVYFATAKATIRKRSFPLLSDVAQALQDNPKIAVRIEGHTDSRGSDKYNKKLSTARAGSVRKYLIDKGIDESRMTSEGYGERVPIADNRTKGGREQNRRVEFVIVSR